jgi:molybdate transport system substrate-binding protein
MKKAGLAIAVTAVVIALCAGFSAPARAADQVMVFAAASLTNALTDIGKIFDEKKIGTVVSSFASSSTLAKQIENGAPANVFLSADEEWMNYLAEKRFIVPESRFNLLGNQLVLIAPAGSDLKKVDIAPGFPLAKMLGSGLLATGDPDHVPAGKYAKSALQKLGVWADVDGKLARADNVRAALALVERGECPLGIVYSTDAALSQKVKVVGTFPEDSHPPITYPAALIAGKDSPAARAFLDFLKTPEAKTVFEKYGFAVR